MIFADDRFPITRFFVKPICSRLDIQPVLLQCSCTNHKNRSFCFDELRIINSSQSFSAVFKRSPRMHLDYHHIQVQSRIQIVGNAWQNLCVEIKFSIINGVVCVWAESCLIGIVLIFTCTETICRVLLPKKKCSGKLRMLSPNIKISTALISRLTWHEHPEYYRIRHYKADDWQAYNYMSIGEDALFSYRNHKIAVLSSSLYDFRNSASVFWMILWEVQHPHRSCFAWHPRKNSFGNSLWETSFSRGCWGLF